MTPDTSLLILISFCLILYFIPNVLDFFNFESTKTKSYDLTKKINNKNREFIKTLVKLETEIPNEENNRELFDKYYKGVDSTYDLMDNQIPGIEPNPTKALYYLDLVIKGKDGKNDDVLQLAEIYHQGMHKLKPDLDKALKIYTDILNNVGETLVRDKAYEGITDINKIKALKWLNLPKDHDPNRPDNLNVQVQQADIERLIGVNAELINEPEIIEILNDETFDINMAIQLNNEANRVRTDKPKRGTKVYNDTQNTHDSQVLSTIRHSLDNLKSTTKLDISEAETLYQIKKFLNTKPKSHKFNDAIKSLNKIESTTHTLSNSGMRETEGLQLVWNRIHDPMHDENRENLKNTLFNELSEMQIHGANVCSTGRFDRIIDTLNVVDPAVNIRPTHAINEEMLNKSALIRTQLLENQDNKDDLERGTATNQTQFDTDLKAEIINTLTHDYVDTKILTPKQFKNELDKWIDHI